MVPSTFPTWGWGRSHLSIRGQTLLRHPALFKPKHKVSNNIAEYEGLLVVLRAASALGIKCLIVKGDLQLVVNLSNKSYTPKGKHMAAYLEEHMKMEKCFQGMELKHIPRGQNVEVDEIAKHASHRLA
jgi:ribonuclease HI